VSQSGTPGSSATGARQNASPGRGGRVRDSFEWVFKHGFSSDSSRKSMNQGNNGSVPRILEGKHADEELAYRNLAHYGQSLKFHHGESRQSLSSTPDPLAFALAPAVHDPSLSAVPVRDVYSGKLVRNYEQHPSRNRFFFGGRLLTGGDSPWAFVASFGAGHYRGVVRDDLRVVVAERKPSSGSCRCIPEFNHHFKYDSNGECRRWYMKST